MGELELELEVVGREGGREGGEGCGSGNGHSFEERTSRRLCTSRKNAYSQEGKGGFG